MNQIVISWKQMLVVLMNLVLLVLIVYVVYAVLKGRQTGGNKHEQLELESTREESLGEKLKDLRSKSGMTQEMVAEKLGVSRQAVAKWENDKSYPSTANIMAIADLFGVSIERLISTQNSRIQ